MLKNILFVFALLMVLPKAQALNEEFVGTLNIGWPKQLSALNQQTNDGKSYLVVISLMPQPAVDIESAEAFRRSLIEVAADGDESILGHVMFGWKCPTAGGVLHGMSAMTGESSDQIYRMTKSGWGYTSMMSTFTDGFLQNAEEIGQEEIEDNMKKGKSFLSMAIEVTPQECMNFYNALKTFVTHPNVPMNRFGSMTDPSAYTGGGCISTALSFFSKAKVLPDVANFKRTVPFNKKFIGKGDELPKKTELPNEDFWKNRSRISFDTLVFSSWAVKPSDDTITMNLEDPELLIAFMKSAIGIATGSRLSAGKLTERLYHSIEPDPAGEDHYGVNRRFSWTKYYKTADNNQSYRRMYDLAGQWLKERGGSASPLQLLGENTILLRK